VHLDLLEVEDVLQSWRHLDIVTRARDGDDR
jgi:hypothetical protein